jgi:hypothetical protein
LARELALATSSVWWRRRRRSPRDRSCPAIEASPRQVGERPGPRRAHVASTIKGSIDNSSFLKAGTTAKSNLPGEIPAHRLHQPWGQNGGLAAYNRFVNTYVSFDEIQNGKLVLLTSTFENDGSLATGKK